MYKVYLEGHDFHYEMENVIRAFTQDISVVKGRPTEEEGQYIYLRQSRQKQRTRLLCVLRTHSFRAVKDSILSADAKKADCEAELARLLYDVMCLTVRRPPVWGIITGVRPAKQAAVLMESGKTCSETAWDLSANKRVAARKAVLAVDTAKRGKSVARGNTPRSYSLYVSIPFCPSRCSYCSFVSKTVGKDRLLVDGYLRSLYAELERTSQIARQIGLRLETIYIGGGTPTFLSEAQLYGLCEAIDKNFSVKQAAEYSVEAGRPDTITPQKLKVLKDAGVGRISINPQTVSDEVLTAIGRNHTAHDVERAFEQARKAGFDAINADIIAGLPRDSLTGFIHTMEWVMKLRPENVTVHALTKKRSSRIYEYGTQPSRDAADMVDHSVLFLRSQGYVPYYMYKQKGTVEGLENTGWSKPAFECLYNVYMMDEWHTILACGAGSVTKMVHQKAGKIERILNYKYPADYLSCFDLLMERKEKVLSFYEGLW